MQVMVQVMKYLLMAFVICASVVALFGCVSGAQADSITIDGTTYGGVIISEGASMYYVRIPSAGTVMNASKASVDPSSITYTEDGAVRGALLDDWKAAQSQSAALISYKASALMAARTNLGIGTPLPEASYSEEDEIPVLRKIGGIS